MGEYGDDAEVIQAPLAKANFKGVIIDQSDGLGTVTLTKYTMVGTDAVTTAREPWEVVGYADPTAAQYSGGLATPLRNVQILSKR
jgi:hypothetical protein